MTQSLPPTFCVLPWISLTLGPLGTVTPCCTSQYSLGHIETDTLTDIWQNSEKLKSIREATLNGTWHAACISCKSKEKKNLRSRRIAMSEREELQPFIAQFNPEAPSGDELLHVEFDFANLCNLKCQMCDSRYSTKWRSEQKALNDALGRKTNVHKAHTTSLEQVKDVLPLLEPTKIIEFKGGEPTIIPVFDEVMQYLIDQGWTDKTITVVTNLTEATPEQFARFAAFKVPNVVVSIDATGELYRYMRGWPLFDFDHIDRQVRALVKEHPSIKVTISCTFQSLNAMSIEPLVDWFNALREEVRPVLKQAGGSLSLRFGFVTYPEAYMAGNLPDELKKLALEGLARAAAKAPSDHAREDIEHCQMIVRTPANPDMWQRFIERTIALDTIRNADIRLAVPEMSGYFPSK